MKLSEKETQIVHNSAMKESPGCLTAYTYLFRSIPFAVKKGVYRIFLIPVSIFFAVFIIATILGIVVSFIQSVASVYPTQHAIGMIKAQLALQLTLIFFLLSFMVTFIAFTDVFRQITLKTEDIMKGKKINGIFSVVVPPVGMVVTLGVMGIMNSIDSIFFYHIARRELFESFRWIWEHKAMFFGFMCSNIVIMWTPLLNLSGIFLACMAGTRMIIHEKITSDHTGMITNESINDPDAHCDLGTSILSPSIDTTKRETFDDDDDDEGDIELEGLNKEDV